MLRNAWRWLFAPKYRFPKIMSVFLLALIILFGLLFLAGSIGFLIGPSGERFLIWAVGNVAQREPLIITQREACPGAPFVLPADGFVGLPYASAGGPYSRANPHQGIDIFSPDRNTPGLTPVYAAYDGYITREDSWRSSLIQRIPDDPLIPGRQIWLYYAHMADAGGNDFIVDQFAPGSRDIYVDRGTLLGYTGNYNGNSPRGIWVHLHFSIVKDDGKGGYLNELEFENTVNPSPYFGMALSDTCSLPASGCGPLDGCL